MATHSGNSGLIIADGSTIAEVLDFSLTESINIIDDSQLTDAADTHATGSTTWSGSINCFWDETDTAQIAMTVGASISIDLRPEGSTIPYNKFTGTCTIESIERSVARNSIVTASFSFTGDGALTEATVAA